MNPFGSRQKLKTATNSYDIFRLDALSQFGDLTQLPISIKIMLESVLRKTDGIVITENDVASLAKYNAKQVGELEVPFMPARVLLQDFTGVPAMVDMAAMRSAVNRMGGNPSRINPLVQVDLVIDHSVQVDAFASDNAFTDNAVLEFQRNRERYEFLRWAQKSFSNFRCVPPATGICHQVNLEYLAKCVLAKDGVAFPDTLVGTDSHTVMINGLGVVGWGVGGIEAEAVMLGQPLYMLAPEVIGFKLTGKLPEGATGTDLVLTITQILRKKGVVSKFVEYFGPALDDLTLPVRAMIGNMAPEYGATMGYFPVDSITLDYLRMTGRSDDEIDLVERYCKEQGLFRVKGATEPVYTDIVELDISTIEPSLAGPKRPQDLVPLRKMKQEFQTALTRPLKDRGFELKNDDVAKRIAIHDGINAEVGHGVVVIAAITSCTNTSDPYVMIASGILAKKAIEKGLTRKPWVKTSLAPGSRVVIEYLEKAGLIEPLKGVGFHNVGFGCTTCIGNSGPLPEAVSKAITDGDLVAAAVLSGNRNFEGRINPQTKANFLASPPLVVAYALAGRADIDFATESIGNGTDGKPVFLKDIWPSQMEILEAIKKSVTPELFRSKYGQVFDGNPDWNKIASGDAELYDWDADSTYLQEPPFFVDMAEGAGEINEIKGARALALFGDSITTDHISPAGAIKKDSPAGKFLVENGVTFADFNSYGSRRGNDRVMTRGTFANVRLRNLLAPGTEGGVTIHLPSGQEMPIYDAAMKYQQDSTPLVIIAGKDYGMGSSRDWAAKGTMLLGVKAVLAESFERIHRSNLVGMGVLPLQFLDSETRETHNLTGHETFSLEGLTNELKPKQNITVWAAKDGKARSFHVMVRIDTPIEVEYYRHGGILQMVLRQLMGK
jgi:aconitate hydratase